MSKSDPSATRKERRKTILWVVKIFLITILVSGTISFVSDAITILVSGTISFVSDAIMAVSTMAVAFLILLAIIFVGIIFDVIGVAVTSADEKPFHSMAARKVPGAQESIHLLRNAERVSSICNDVVGDICGVVSGSASATIAVQVMNRIEFSREQLVALIMSALVAGLTVGGKAIGKTFAIGSCTKIVENVGKLIWGLGHLPELFRKKNK